VLAAGTEWASFSSATAGRPTSAIFSRSRIADDLDPRRITVRESRDSPDNPNSTAIIVGLDVTGSMGVIADNLARTGLGTLVGEILDRKPVPDPHIAFMGIGDAWCDRYPLQVTQFEADIRIAATLKDLYLEKGGGGNSYKSYNLPWYFAARHTSIDCFERRGRKGYLFTVGDEEAPPVLLASHIREVIGDEAARDISTPDLLAMASRTYNVFHCVIEQGSYASACLDKVLDSWHAVLGQRVLRVGDYDRLPEVIVSAIEVTEGRDHRDVARSWPGSTTRVVGRAIANLPAASPGTGIVRF